MTTKYLTAAYPAGYALSANFAGLVIESTASVGGAGVTAAHFASIANYGSVAASGTADGVSLSAGGQVTNGNAGTAGANISGYRGVEISGGAGVVNNLGVIEGEQRSGVYLHDGGKVVNGSLTDTTALIAAGVAEGGSGTGVLIYGGAATILNYGTIASSQTGAYLYGGAGTLVNGALGDLTALIDASGIGVAASDGVVRNFATILGGASQNDSGVQVLDSGLFNGSAKDTSALIKGYSGVGAFSVDPGGSSVTNFGTILGTGRDVGSAGVELAVGGTLTNGSAIDIAALIQGGAGVGALNFSATVQNFGTIQGETPKTGQGVYLQAGGLVVNGSTSSTAALIVGSTGVLSSQAAATVRNWGNVFGVYTAIDLASGLVVNGGNADTSALIEAGTGVVFEVGAGTLENFGTIVSGFYPSVLLKAGGMVVNGSVADTTARMDDGDGVVAMNQSATVANFGTIRAISGAGFPGFGVTLDDGGLVKNGSIGDTDALIAGVAGIVTSGASATILNFATISASKGAGVSVVSGRVINGSDGDAVALIDGQIGVSVSGVGTVTNFGVIEGDGRPAVLFGSAADVLRVEAGCAFDGAVMGDAGTLDLASGSGIISGLANGNVTVSGSMALTSFTKFGTLEIASGAAFALSGAGTIASGGTGVLQIDGALAIGQAGSLDDDGLVDQSGTVLLRKRATAPRLTIGSGATYQLDGDVGIARRASAAPMITIEGLFIKSGGTGLSAVGISIADNGTIEAATGALALMAPVTGAGVMTIDAGATLEAASTISARLTALFAGSDATLALAQPSTFAATIAGFAATDAIDLLNITATSEVLGPGDTLVIANGATTIATLKLSGDFAGATFATDSDGHGGTSITLSGGVAAPPPPAVAPSLSRRSVFIASMASLGAEVGSAHRMPFASPEHLRMTLAAPRLQAA